MNPKTVIAITALVGIAARYHLKELARVHLHGFNNGWEAGKNFERKNRDSDS